MAISIAVALAIWFYFYCSANHASGLFEGQMICIGVMMAFAAVLWGIRKMI